MQITAIINKTGYKKPVLFIIWCYALIMSFLAMLDSPNKEILTSFLWAFSFIGYGFFFYHITTDLALICKAFIEQIEKDVEQNDKENYNN